MSMLFFTFFVLLGIADAQTAISGDITSNMTLTANNTYLLKGLVRVQSGATLTIEPGTV
ncbi:MAG: T9SS C-terminal target domain-containing protein, partial [Bacteroidota bacterium]